MAKCKLDRKGFLVGAGGLAIAVVFLAFKQFPIVRVYPHVHTLFNLILKSSCAIGLLFISGMVPVMFRFVCWTGGISYALYLLHGYFMWIVSDGGTNRWVFDSIILVIVSCIAAAVFNLLQLYLRKRMFGLYGS